MCAATLSSLNTVLERVEKAVERLAGCTESQGNRIAVLEEKCKKLEAAGDADRSDKANIASVAKEDLAKAKAEVKTEFTTAKNEVKDELHQSVTAINNALDDRLDSYKWAIGLLYTLVAFILAYILHNG